MPSKGRSHPCDDPMKKGHKKQSQYKDVFAVGDQFLKQLRDTLPEIKWKEGTRMCGICRSKAAYKIKLRNDLLRAAEEEIHLAEVAPSTGNVSLK